MKAYGATILRIFLGIIYAMHAYRSLVVFTPAATADFLAKVVGLPAPMFMAWALIVVHGVGGLMLILGLWTRAAAAANAVVMLIALLTVHRSEGFFLKVVADGTAVGGFEFAFLLFGATVAQLALGSGRWAVKLSK